MNQSNRSFWLLMFLLIASVNPQLLAQGLNDGPFLTWLSAEKVLLEGICDSRPYAKEINVKNLWNLENPCNGEGVSVVSSPMTSPAGNFNKVDRFLAISDVEGHYQELLTLLKNQAVINARNEWIWGNAHLVFIGDMVDRGEYVTEVLWLIHKLEKEALKAGGQVHYLLGNHEKMALEGDSRYLNPKYEEVEKVLDRPYKDFFKADTELGRWLRSRNVMLKLNDTLFVHGGLASKFASLKMSLENVNQATRMGLNDSELASKDAKVKWLLSSEGPLWYRGYFKDEDLKVADIQATLNQFGAARIVVGHTIVPQIESLHEGLVLGIDTSFAKPDRIQGLLFDKGRFWRAGIKGDKTLLPLKN